MPKKEYYNYPQSSEAHYSQIPSDRLDVGKMLQNKPCWRARLGAENRRRKKLIISENPYPAGWSSEQKIILTERLAALEKEGFEIVAFASDEITLQKFELSVLITRDNPIIYSARSENILSDACEQLASSADDIFILDTNKLIELQDGDDEDWNTLTSFKIVNLAGSNISIKTLNRLFKQHGPEIEALGISECLNLADGVIDASALSNLRVLNVSGDETYGRFPKMFGHSASLFGRDDKISMLSEDNILKLILPSVQTIAFLSLSASVITPAGLSLALEKTVQLEELYLNGCSVIYGEFPDGAPRLNLSSLKKLDLSRTNITLSYLFQILNNTPNLKTLGLRVCRNLTDTFLDQATSNILSLEKLDLICAQITDFGLYKILEIAPNLKSVILHGCLSVTIDAINKIKADRSLIEIETYIEYHSTLAEKGITIHDNVTRKYKSQTAEQSRLLDANTKCDPNEEFKCDQVFFSDDKIDEPAVNHYRLSVFNAAEIVTMPCDISAAFKLKNKPDDLQLQIVPDIKKISIDLFGTMVKLPDLNKKIYYGKIKIILTNNWQAIPSLSTAERMLAYHIDSGVNVSIQYSNRDNLYYIKNVDSSEQKAITLDFILEIPEQEKQVLPNEIEAIITFCSDFKEGALKISKPDPTGNDYYTALKNQKFGSCRHRSFVFKAMMQEAYPAIPVRIVNNDCHSFVEIRYKNKWVIRDLGGYAGKLTVNQAMRPISGTAKQKTAPAPIVMQLTSTGKITKSSKTQSQSIFKSLQGFFQSSRPKTVIPKQKKQYFTTQQRKAAPDSILAYAQALLKPSDDKINNKKILLTVKNSADIASLRYHLQDYCTRNKQPCIYIHSPDDLICSSAYVKREKDNTGTINKGPGGTLHAFLTAHAVDGSYPTLIINYDNFKASDIVRFNTLLDPERKADGTSLPNNCKVIGIVNPEKPGAYAGTDFYSRFDRVEPVLLTSDKIAAPSIISSISSKPSEKILLHEIELFGGENWEEKLLGHWTLRGIKLIFVEGELEKAEKTQKTHFILKNAPWHDDKFVSFWQEKLIKNKKMTVSKNDGYSFEQYREKIKLAKTIEISSKTQILNPETLSQFFGKYSCSDQSLVFQEGSLAQNKDKTIEVYLSHTISDAAWAEILSICVQKNITIELLQAPDTRLPSELKIAAMRVDQKSVSENLMIRVCHCIDRDAVIKTVQDAIVIDVSEIPPADLFVKINGKFNQEKLEFLFTEEMGLLEKFLSDSRNIGKTIVLTGEFSEAHQQHFADFLAKKINESIVQPCAKLILLSEKPLYFVGIKTEVNTDACAKNTDLASSYLLPETINPEDSIEDQANAFNQHRFDQVKAALGLAPFVLLSGMTGVGKTTFIDEVWAKKTNGVVHKGEDNILAWAIDQTPGTKTLFIDEANITSRQWSEFEGLFYNPKSIVIGNMLYPLSDEHKVIFAGNPSSYGGERQMPSLFKRHNNSVVFEPVALAYIEYTMLSPALIDIADQDIKNSIIKPILEIAKYLTSISKDRVLITPRELITMALMTHTYLKNHSDADPRMVSKYYAYILSKSFVPSEHLSEFEAKFKVDTINYSNTLKNKAILINNTNQSAFNALTDFLALRAVRQRNSNSSPIQQSGGLGGLVIEGPPGAGKSELVIQTLLNAGLSECKLKNNTTINHRNHFYRLPASMPLREKKSLLTKAFYEGSVVIVDEINSAAMMERFLNDLLMGKIPNDPDIKNQIEKYNQSSKKPTVGFLLIGTQNPSIMNGRIKETEAMLHRMQKAFIGNYTKPEIINILISRGLNKLVAIEMTDEYLLLLNNKNQAVCFRDLLKLSKKFQKHCLKNLSPVEMIELNKEKINELLSEYQLRKDNPARLFNFSATDKLAAAEKILTGFEMVGSRQDVAFDLAAFPKAARQGRLGKCFNEIIKAQEKISRQYRIENSKTMRLR